MPLIINNPVTTLNLAGPDKSIETTIKLSNNRTLRVLTRKSVSGSLNSVAHVGKSKETNDSTMFFTAYGDFRKGLITSQKRVTSKAIQEQHTEALSMADGLLQAIEEHYKDVSLAGGVKFAG